MMERFFLKSSGVHHHTITFGIHLLDFLNSGSGFGDTIFNLTYDTIFIDITDEIFVIFPSLGYSKCDNS